MERKKVLLIIEQFFIISGVHLFFSVYLKSFITPSLFLIWLLILTWEGNSEIALLMAFISGLLNDFFSKTTPGITGIIFLLIVYLNSFFKNEALPSRILSVFLFSFLYFVLMALDLSTGFLWKKISLFKYAFLFSLYNSFTLFIIEIIRRKLKWKKKIYFEI